LDSQEQARRGERLGAGDGLAALLVGMLKSLYGVRRVAANAAWQDICEAHRAVVRAARQNSAWRFFSDSD